MIVSEENKFEKREPIPQGLYPAICISIVGIGEVDNSFTGKPQQKVVFTFELPTQRVEYKKDGVDVTGPANLSNTYTLSLHEKSKMRKDLEGWRGRPFTTEELVSFDLKKVLGAPLQVLIKHNQGKDGNTYANIDSIIKYEGAKIEPEVEIVMYDANAHSDAEYAKIKPWLQKKVTLPDGSCPYKEPQAGAIPAKLPSGAVVTEEEEIPF